MTEFIGFGGSNPSFVKEQKEFFDDAEKAIGVPLYVVCGISRTGDLSRPDGCPEDALVLHDFNIPKEHVVGPSDTNRVNLPTVTGVDTPVEKWPYRYRYSSLVEDPRILTFTCPDRSWTLGFIDEKLVCTAISLTNFNRKLLESLHLVPKMKEALDVERLEKRAKQHLDAVIKRAADRMKGAVNSKAENIKQEIQMLENQLAGEQAESIRKVRSMQEKAIDLKYLEQMRSTESDQFAAQISQLMSNIHVKDLDYRDNNLIVHTNLIYLYSPTGSERVPLGRMTIWLNQNGSIKIYNNDNARGPQPKAHPHVNTEGQACWGGIQQQITKLTANFEIVALFETIFTYLENYNPEDDYGRFAPHWFDTQDVQYLQENGMYLTKKELKQQEEKDNKEKSSKETESTQTNQPQTTTSI